jgi:hypothetical protein
VREIMDKKYISVIAKVISIILLFGFLFLKFEGIKLSSLTLFIMVFIWFILFILPDLFFENKPLKIKIIEFLIISLLFILGLVFTDLYIRIFILGAIIVVAFLFKERKIEVKQ